MPNKIITLLLLFLASAIFVEAKKDSPDKPETESIETDSVATASETKQQIILQSQTKADSLTTERADTTILKEEIEKLITANRNLTDSIKEYKKNLDSLNTVRKEERIRLEEELTKLITNNLYIPFDAYNVEEGATPMISIITTESILKEEAAAFELMRNFRADIDSTIVFIEQFNNDQKAFRIPVNIPQYKDEYIKKLKDSEFFKRYQTYEDWENTWLGIRIKAIMTRIIDAEAKKSRPEFNDIKEELSTVMKQ